MRMNTLIIDERGNLSVLVDGKPIPDVTVISAAQSVDKEHNGYASVTLTILAKVERKP